jgi:hypothetical protein
MDPSGRASLVGDLGSRRGERHALFAQLATLTFAAGSRTLQVFGHRGQVAQTALVAQRVARLFLVGDRGRETSGEEAHMKIDLADDGDAANKQTPNYRARSSTGGSL